MTPTRKYYESLIELFARLNESTISNPLKYLEVKSEINNLVNRIQKFDLITLTFSDDFFELLNLDTIVDFQNEKLLISNELHYELNECLNTDRLRFGGELVQYVSRIKIALLKLTLDELVDFENIKKKPNHYFFPEKFQFSTEKEKQAKIIELKALDVKNTIKERVVIRKNTFIELEETLVKFLAIYRNYIIEHYPTWTDNFMFCNKRIVAYITEAMPKDIFELRIHSYTSTNGDISIKLKQEYFDFYPAYFNNLEEITEILFGAHVTSLNKKDFSFRNPFTIENIHHELSQLFFQNSNEKEIEKFAEFLLKCDGYRINESGVLVDKEFDLSASKNHEEFLFEIYHHKSRSTERIKRRIESIKITAPNVIPCFIFTSFPGDVTYNILQKANIKSIFIKDLIRNHFNLNNSQIIHWYIKSRISSLIIKSNSTEIKLTGENLISKLENCLAGEKNWSDYENIGVKIFDFLFKDNFKKYLREEQIENDLKNHRRDLLVNNNYSDPTSFWADVKSNYNCSAIIVDFKNYSKKLNSTNFFNVSKYTKKNVGNFALIFSRKGLDDTAKIEQRSLFANGKLLIVFSDVELMEMISEKIIGKDPIDRLESKKFELVKKY